jgi:exopolyphosphatase/guanosine-5'-triphosphate,3'-diphosphate pyrophosphatase
LAIGIGGTTRTLAKAIIKKGNYPLNKLHAFSYTLKDQQDYLKQIASSDLDRLNTLHIKENRHDTIREGTLIFLEILRYIDATRVMTSGVGVREGVYLHDKLSKVPYKLPINSNPSITSIRDRFDILSLPYGNKKEIATKLYEIFKHYLDHEEKYLSILEKTLSLSNIGKILTIYQKDKHASYIAMQELNYGFSHEEMVLISLLLYTKGKRGYHKVLYKQYKTLLPSKQTVKWLAFMYSLTLMLHRCSTKAHIKFSYKHHTLHITSNKTLYIVVEDIKEMKKPNKLRIVI